MTYSEVVLDKWLCRSRVFRGLLYYIWREYCGPYSNSNRSGEAYWEWI